jgi:hypothetical protein
VVPVVGKQSEEVGKTDAGQGFPLFNSSRLHMFEITLWLFQFDFYCLFGQNTCHSCCEAKNKNV